MDPRTLIRNDQFRHPVFRRTLADVMRTRLLSTLVPTAALLVALTACSSGGAPAAPTDDRSASATADPTSPPALRPGWDAATGTITLGDGPTRIDVWFDPMCPNCKQFDEAQREALADWSTRDGSQVVLHPLTFLDRASQGSAYSTRAATVLATAAEQDPAAVLAILLDLYDRQPAEQTAGLDDAALRAIASAHGVDAAEALADRPWDATFRKTSAEAFSGRDAITGTPTMRVDGREVPSGQLYEPDLRRQVDTYLDQR
jgi:protein-disulfide isomerase